jgi:hypothetical protein
VRGGVGGTGYRGGTSGIDTTPPGRGNSYEYYRQDDLGGAHSASTPLYCAGLRNFPVQSLNTATAEANLGQMQGGGTGDALYAIPERFGFAGTIHRLVNKYLGGGDPTAAAVRMGVYSNLSQGDYYPAALLGETSSLGVNGTTIFLSAIGGDELLEIPVSANDLLWFVFTSNVIAQTPDPASVIGIFETAVEPLLGSHIAPLGFFSGAAGRDSESFGIGWRHARAYGPLPATFPRTAPTRLVTDSEGGANRYVPAVFYGFENA